jgi:hypothetical protein
LGWWVVVGCKMTRDASLYTSHIRSTHLPPQQDAHAYAHVPRTQRMRTATTRAGLLAVASPIQRPSQLHRHASSLARPVRAGLGVDGGGGGEKEEEEREEARENERDSGQAYVHVCASDKAPSPSVHRRTTADLPARAALASAVGPSSPAR